MAALVLLLMVCVSAFGSIHCYKLKEIVIENAHKQKMFHPKDIAQYDGSDPNLPIFMAVKGVVFDVTKGKSFYGKGKGYNALVGKDATRGVAKMSLEEADLVPDISDLSDDQLEALDRIYEEVYKPKYQVVGYMDYLLQAQMGKHSSSSVNHNLKDDL